MKATLKVMGAIFALGFIVLVGLQIIMQYGLTKAMREVVLPKVKQETGIDARVGRLSINMANGLLFLNDIEVRNPEGFLLENLASFERIVVEVDVASLFTKDPILVKNIEVENALVNVIRNKDGEFNVAHLQERIQKPVVPSEQEIPAPETPQQWPVEQVPPPIERVEPFPEVRIESILVHAECRYMDFKLNELDIALDLDISGKGLSTETNPKTPWGNVVLQGSTGDDRSRFITQLNLRLAPVTNPQAPSFVLTGKVMEIDPRIMESIYRKMGIRSAPFGMEPKLYCREGQFEKSDVAFSLRDIQLENKLADRLGGMGTIGALRFVVPVSGSLKEPVVNMRSALMSAIGGNTRTLLDSFLKGVMTKEEGMDPPPETVSEAAVEMLGEQVDEIGESKTIKKILKDLADGKPSATNTPDPISSDTIVDILGEQVKEIDEDEELKDELKNLGKWLFGK